MYFKISDTKRGKKSFTCDGYLCRGELVVQRSFKNRQCHVNNIPIILEHNDEQDEKS